MSFDADVTYYEILEVSPDASPQEIREAYFRAKAAYKKDSIALYSLMSPEETREVLDQIEVAYSILSNPEKRKDYDSHYGILRVELTEKVVSIDRFPPMEETNGNPAMGDDLLIAPRTDFEARATTVPKVSPDKLTRSLSRPTTTISCTREIDGDLEQQIQTRSDWSGDFLRQVREAKNISLEEMAGFTKLSKTYITAIEEENFQRLPASVYLRGFVTLIAKGLSLPYDKVCAGYMARYQKSMAEK